MLLCMIIEQKENKINKMVNKINLDKKAFDEMQEKGIGWICNVIKNNLKNKKIGVKKI